MATKRVLPLIKLDHHYLSPAFCPFILKTTYQKEIITVSTDQFDDWPDINFFLTGKSQGETLLEIRVTHTFKGASTHFNDSTKIKISEPLGIHMLSYFNETGYRMLNLIAPVNQKFELPIPSTSSSLTLKEGPCELKDRFLIVLEYGHCTIVLKQGKDEHIITVKGSKLDSFIVNNRENLVDIPVYATSKNKISFLDSFGQLFTYGYDARDLSFINLNSDIVDIQFTKEGIVINSKKEGLAKIEIVHPVFKMKDIFYVKVKGEITPQKLVIHKGGEIVMVGKSVTKNHNWRSDNPKRFTIDPQSGKGKAFDLGSVRVFYDESGLQEKVLEIVQLDDIRYMDKGFIFNDARTHELSFALFSGNIHIKSLNDWRNENNNLHFECSSQQNFVRTRFGVRTLDSQQVPFCQIEIIKELVENLSQKTYINILTVVKSNTTSFAFQKEHHIPAEWGVFVYSNDNIQLSQINPLQSISLYSESPLKVSCLSQYIKLYQYNTMYQLSLDFTGLQNSLKIECLLQNSVYTKKILIEYVLDETGGIKAADYIGFFVALVLVWWGYKKFFGGGNITSVRGGQVVRTGVLSGGDQRVRGFGNNQNLVRTLNA